jgi:hypothetical protein
MQGSDVFECVPKLNMNEHTKTRFVGTTPIRI